MKYLLNGKERENLKVMNLRKIQVEAYNRILENIQNNLKLLVNMPCRTGKTFTTLYSAYKAGVQFVIVLCGKASAKASYASDSAWINKETGEVEGFTIVATENHHVKELLRHPELITAQDKVLIEVTPQLLNKTNNKELLEVLHDLASNRRSLFVFDEAHFTEQTKKTKNIITSITATGEETLNADELNEIGIMPWVYLTASPDTQSLQNVFTIDNENYYELTKEREWELYEEDMQLPEEEREFDYIPVRNCLYIMNKLFDSVYNSAKSSKQDYISLFTQNNARMYARRFVKKSLLKTIEIIKAGPESSYMQEFEEVTYVQRGTNVNLMIKVPVNSKKANKSNMTVAQNIIQRIREVESEILSAYPEYTSIEIKDVTLSNNINQKEANAFFDDNKTSINIILTQQRLIEGCTLYNLDAFLYYCNSGSLIKYKQESGRTLTPSENKRFGFILFFDEDALANVKALLLAKINKLKGTKKGPRKLTATEAKRMTRINPAFIVEGNDEMKLIDYGHSLYTKSDLENTRVRSNLFDKSILLSIPGLRDLISNLLCKMTNNTTRDVKGSSTKDTDGTNSGRKRSGHKIDANTPLEEIETEKFVDTIIYMYQDCIQNEVEINSISARLNSEAEINGLGSKALQLLYNNEHTYAVMMEIHEVLNSDQEVINPEEV